MPQGIEIPIFEKYGGKGDPSNHVNAYTTLCSDFFLDDKLLAKLFPRTLKDTTLEWFSSLPNNSICSFNELVDAYINNFQVHMTPKKTLTDLMRCKQHEEEKITDFISRYQSLYSQIDVNIPDPHLQRMFIENLQTKLQDKLTMMKFPSFMHVCTTLCDYHNLVSSHDAKSTSSRVEKSEHANSNNSQSFQKQNKGLL